jgi:hypothetical protein
MNWINRQTATAIQRISDGPLLIQIGGRSRI